MSITPTNLSLPIPATKFRGVSVEVLRALEEVQFSLVSNRGCFGGCSFCALPLHRSKYLQVRGMESLNSEAKILALHPDFKGYCVLQSLWNPLYCG